MGLFDKLFKRNKEQEAAKETLDKGLEKTKEEFFARLSKAVARKSTVDTEVGGIGEDIHHFFLENTVQFGSTQVFIAGTSELNRILQEEMVNILIAAHFLFHDLHAYPFAPDGQLIYGAKGLP